MRIAICDDEIQWINSIENYIRKIKNVYQDIVYDVFQSGEELLSDYSKQGNTYDIVILDIEMQNVSGIEVAEQIREKDNAVVIFFLTSHKEYVFDCFRPSPMNFWTKPLSYKIFKEDMKRAYERIKKSEQYISIVENRCRIRIKCADILYIENVERKLLIYTINEIYKINRALSDLEKELDSNTFVRIYKSIIINLAYVHIIGESDVKLYDCDELLPVSRTYKSQLTDSFIHFKEREYF